MNRRENPVSFVGRALSWRREGPALEVALHRPPCNEIGTTALDELELLAELVRNGADGARALILHSTVERGFCAGADLRELQSGMQAREWIPGPIRRPLVRLKVLRFLNRIHRVFDTLDTAPLTTIAAVHRVCFGGGFELALTADVIVADKTARFCFPELRLGLIPGFGGIPRLERDVGNAVVRDLLLTGRSLGAKRAHEVGLVSQLVGRGQALEAARSIARQSAKFDPATVAAGKRFAKRLPRARLRAEKRVFSKLVTQPAVLKALTDFVEDEGPMPYLPKESPVAP